MKRAIFYLATFITIITDGLTAQQYHPMPEGEARWDITRCWGFYPGGWHDEYSIRMDGADTLMYGRLYKKLWLVTHHLPGTQFDSVYTNFLGGMREADKQVFFVSEYLTLDTIERMVYDFNEVVPGDTIYTQVLTNGLTQFIAHIVVSVDEVDTQDGLRRRINLADESGYFFESWTEGIGSNLGLTYASYWILTDNSYDLNCFYDQGDLDYVNPAPQYMFCTAPLPEITCDSLSTSESGIPEEEEYFIYPNPAADFLQLNSFHEVHSLMVLDILGRPLLHSGADDQVDVRTLPPGIYALQLINERRIPITVIPFIKQ